MSYTICICGNESTKYCKNCKSEKYCSRECQVKDWKRHKLECNKETSSKKEDLIRYWKKGVLNGAKPSNKLPNTLAESQRMFARSFGVRDKENDENGCFDHHFFEYISKHINTKWKMFLDELVKYQSDTLCYDKSLDYIGMTVITVPKNDIIYKNAIPKPNYWTFCFITCKKHPKNMFLSFSDDDLGVCQRYLSLYGGYVCDNNIVLLGSKNIIKEPFICTIDENNPEYCYVDWDTGVPKHMTTISNFKI